MLREIINCTLATSGIFVVAIVAAVVRSSAIEKFQGRSGDV